MENVNNNTSTRAENTEEKVAATRDPIELEFEPIKFNSVAETSITTTNELAKLINEIFKNIFEDFYGSAITVQYSPVTQTYIISPVLYFKMLPNDSYKKDGIYAFNPINVANKKDTMVNRVQRIASVIGTNNSNNVVITDDFKNILKDFIIGPNNNIDWKAYYSTWPINSGNCAIRVFKLDVLKFLKKIYGEKDDMGGECYYQPTIIRPINPIQQYSQATDWAISIMRLNWTNEVYAAKLQGFMINNDNVPNNIVLA